MDLNDLAPYLIKTYAYDPRGLRVSETPCGEQAVRVQLLRGEEVLFQAVVKEPPTGPAFALFNREAITDEDDGLVWDILHFKLMEEVSVPSSLSENEQRAVARLCYDLFIDLNEYILVKASELHALPLPFHQHFLEVFHLHGRRVFEFEGTRYYRCLYAAGIHPW